MNDRPVVLHVLEALTAGTARHVADLVRTATSVDHVVVVPSERFGDNTDSRAPDEIRAAGSEVVVVDMRRLPIHPDNARAIRQLRGIISARSPAVVHGHASIGGAIARLAARTAGRVPSVWTPHAVMPTRPVLLAERGFSRLTAQFVAVSPSEEQLLLSHKVAKPGQVTVIANGIDVTPVGTTIELRTKLDIPADAPVVGTIGRLARQKAPLDFIAACAAISRQLPEAHFIVIGDGPQAGEVDAAIAQHGLGRRVHRLAHLPNAAAAVGNFDLFMLLSAYEGGPYAPLEAIREGVPVVLSDVVGNRDVIENGISGFLVPPGEPQEAAAKAAEVLTSSERRNELVTAATRRLHEHFDVRQMGLAHDALYGRLAAR